MKGKIKIFLGGYVNYLNAQNINCRALSEHLDPNRFKVTTLLYMYQNANDFEHRTGVKYLKMHRPGKLWKYILYLRGIATADVAYLPKGEIVPFCKGVAKFFGTRIFTTVEGILDPILEARIGSKKFPKYIEHFKSYCSDNLYPITHYIGEVETRTHNLSFVKTVLYLGVESESFVSKSRKITGILKNIVFIGNDPIRKNVYDLFEAAKLNPNIRFHIVGGNEIKEGKIEDYIKENGLANVTYHGRLDHTRLSELLHGMDLMYFPSRSEGFPKVHLETACAGVPTLCYSDYGATEWITSWENGIVVDTKEEAFEAITKLKAAPETLRKLSENAVELGKSFDWKNLIGSWEAEIERIYNS